MYTPESARDDGATLREQDGLEPGEEFTVERIDRGEYRLGKRRARLESWFNAGVQRLFCIPWEAETGLRWAQLLATLRSSGRSMPIKDTLIAATALVHGLTVATRDRVDFAKAGVEIVDPFAR